MKKEHRHLVQWIGQEFDGRVVLEDVTHGRHVTLHLLHKPSGGRRSITLGGVKNYRDPRCGLNFRADLRRWVVCLEKQPTLSDKKGRRQVLGLPA